MSERQRLDPNAPAVPLVKTAAGILNRGGLVVAPTETRYGILGRADRQEVLERLYSVKRRDINKPTSVLVEKPDYINRLARVNRAAQILIEALLPGPLTVVLPSLEEWFPPVVVDGRTGIRCSPLPFVQRLVADTAALLTATSANRAGKKDFVAVDEIEKEFGDEIDLYVDAGRLAGKTSTVVDCSREEPVILRAGAISRSQVEAALA
jgi:L-threonylcarbamoyladenylate synthase